MTNNCSKCNGTGRIPFRRVDGSIVPNAWVWCDCHEEEPHYIPHSIDDFDFPMSWSWWRYYRRQEGLSDPVPDISPHEEPRRPMAISNMDTAERLQNQINLLHGQMAYLQHQSDKKKVQLVHHQERKKPELKGIES